MSDTDTATHAAPIWERVLQRCWSSPCPNLALYGDWAGWWWCDEHKDRLQDGRAETTVTWEHAVNEIRKVLEMPAPGTDNDRRLLQFDAGIAFCKANHSTLADRWQEVGRQQCEATHGEIRAGAQAEALRRCMQTHGAFYASGQQRGHRQGALWSLGVCLLLAAVAGALGRRWGE